MLWRKVYPLESTIRVMRAGSTLAILTSSSEIHAFSKDTGDMIWSGKTSNSAFDAMFVSDQDDDGQDDLLVVSSDRVELWSGDQATKLWTFDAPTQVRDVAVISKEDIYVAMYENNVLTTQNVALRNGVARGNSKQHEIENVIQGPITIAERSLVMLTKKSELHVLDLKSGSAVVQQLEEGDNTRIESIRRDAPILKVNGVPVFVNLESGEIRELKHSGTATDVVVSKSEQVFVVSADSGEIVVLDANTDKVESRTSIQLENCCGIVTNVFTQIYRKKNDVTSRFRFLLTTSDGTNIMISGEKGETMWIEDGALASVRQVLFTDRAAAAEGIVDEMPSLADRFQSQLETLISSVPSFSLNNNNKDDNNHDTDAFFGFNRIALLRTETGAIYAIETLDGTQIWKTYVSDAKQMFLVNDRTLQVLRRRDGNKDEIVTLNILNGKIVERSGALSFRVKQAVQYHGGALLLRDNMNTVHVFGNNKQDFSDAFMFELDRDQSVFRGLSLRVESDGKIHAVPTWQHVLGSQDDRVVAFTQIDRTRTVGSSARILGDNSVMIRYLNPNLAATISTRGSERLELRVMDTVTGRTVFQQTHTNAASEPCHIVMFENFVVYSYYNIKVQRTEISVVALYDETIGKKDLNGWSTPDCAPHCTSETQSSLKSASKTPIAMTKTYVILKLSFLSLSLYIYTSHTHTHKHTHIHTHK
jgi:outer membrane protein assembly factor BamB